MHYKKHKIWKSATRQVDKKINIKFLIQLKPKIKIIALTNGGSRTKRELSGVSHTARKDGGFKDPPLGILVFLKLFCVLLIKPFLMSRTVSKNLRYFQDPMGRGEGISSCSPPWNQHCLWHFLPLKIIFLSKKKVCVKCG